MTGWPQRGGIGGRRRHADGRTVFASGTQRPDVVWRALVTAVGACAKGYAQGPGPWEALKAARAQALGAAFPIDGEPAKAASGALLELARTWAMAGEDQRGWHGASVLALAKQCEVLMDQQAAGFARRTMGERD